MSGTKRKQHPESTSQHGNTKRQKRTPEPLGTNRAPDPDREAETDSDPIIESDTTEHSGDDDGVSWPSDSDVGGVSVIPLKDNPTEKSKKLPKDSPTAKDTNNQPCEHIPVCYQMIR